MIDEYVKIFMILMVDCLYAYSFQVEHKFNFHLLIIFSFLFSLIICYVYIINRIDRNKKSKIISIN